MFTDILTFKHLTIQLLPLQQGRATRTWSVWNHDYGESLGKIKWYAPWRQYCFITQEQVYSLGCLKDIAAAIQTIQEARVTMPTLAP